ITSPTTTATCGTVNNSASVTTSNDGSASVGPVAITVNCPNLSITKVANPVGPVSAGDPIGFDITVTNNGAGTAHSVTMSDSLPTGSGISWSISPAVSGCSIAANVLSCSFGDMAPSASKLVHVTSPTTSVSWS